MPNYTIENPDDRFAIVHWKGVPLIFQNLSVAQAVLHRLWEQEGKQYAIGTTRHTAHFLMLNYPPGLEPVEEKVEEIDQIRQQLQNAPREARCIAVSISPSLLHKLLAAYDEVNHEPTAAEITENIESGKTPTFPVSSLFDDDYLGQKTLQKLRDAKAEHEAWTPLEGNHVVATQDITERMLGEEPPYNSFNPNGEIIIPQGAEGVINYVDGDHHERPYVVEWYLTELDESSAEWQERGDTGVLHAVKKEWMRLDE